MCGAFPAGPARAPQGGRGCAAGPRLRAGNTAEGAAENGGSGKTNAPAVIRNTGPRAGAGSCRSAAARQYCGGFSCCPARRSSRCPEPGRKITAGSNAQDGIPAGTSHAATIKTANKIRNSSSPRQ